MSTMDILGECTNRFCYVNCQRFFDDSRGKCANCSCPNFQHKLLGIKTNNQIDWIPAPTSPRPLSSSSEASSTSVPSHTFSSNPSSLDNRKRSADDDNIQSELRSLYNRRSPQQQQLQEPSTSSLAAPTRTRGGFGSSKYSATTVSKKAKVEPLIKLALFILPQGVKAPTSAVIKEQLKQCKQYFPDFPYCNSNQQEPITQRCCENDFLQQSDISNLFRQSGYRYYFYHQKGMKLPLRSIYSNSNFPTLEIWKAFAKDGCSSNKTPYCLIVSPTIEEEFVHDDEEDYNLDSYTTSTMQTGISQYYVCSGFW